VTAADPAAVLLTVCVAQPSPLRYRGRDVLSGIDKQPLAGPVYVGALNIDGDRQADLRVHGGPDKAVYVYPASHYAAWQAELGRTLAHGHFGENLTVEGVDEETVRQGDVLAIGGVRLQVTTPRLPCFKLGVRMADQRFLKRFLQSGRTGFYCRVLQEGVIEAGMAVRLLPQPQAGGATILSLSRREAETA
jgi:MOSC domain-containing protein YiiM